MTNIILQLFSGYHIDATGFSGHDSTHDDDGRDERSHFSILGSPCMESRVNLVETQAEMRGCDRIEQISPLNVIDVNKVKRSSLSSSSLASKSLLLMTFL